MPIRYILRHQFNFDLSADESHEKEFLFVIFEKPIKIRNYEFAKYLGPRKCRCRFTG